MVRICHQRPINIERAAGPRGDILHECLEAGKFAGKRGEARIAADRIEIDVERDCIAFALAHAVEILA